MAGSDHFAKKVKNYFFNQNDQFDEGMEEEPKFIKKLSPI